MGVNFTFLPDNATSDSHPFSCQPGQIPPDGWLECAERPGPDYVVAVNWQDDPLEPSLCWEQRFPPLADLKAAAYKAIDASAGRARIRFVSAGELIDQEYKRAEQVARDYIAAGYPVAVPLAIQAEVDRTGSTAQQAADNIIATTNYLNHALDTIRATRLRGKEAVDACSAIDPAAPTLIEQDAVKSAERGAIAALDANKPLVTRS